MDPRKQAIRGLLDEFLTAIKQPDKTPIVPAPNRWFAKPEEFPHVQPMVEKALAASGKTRDDFLHGAFLDPRTGQDLTGRMMSDVGVLIDPRTGRPMMSGRESGMEEFAELEKRLGNQTMSNLVRRSKFKPTGGDTLLNDIPFIATVEQGPHFYALGTEYASPTQLFQVQTGSNPHLRPKSRGDVFGMGEVVGRMQIGKGPEHDVYEKLFVAPRGSDVPGKKLSKAEGGEVHAAGGGLKQAVRNKIDDFLAELNKPVRAAPKAMQQVLPVAERDANLEKFLEPSAVQMRLYHGTPATESGKGKEAIRRIKPSKEGALGSGSYLTPDPRYASGYANEGDANVLPVYAQLKNPLKIEGTHGDPMIEALVKLGMGEDQAARMVEKAYDGPGYIGKQVQSRAQAAGYDGLVQYRDGTPSEVVVYNPNAIKSATGNQGTYDTSYPDLNKAAGGEVHMDKGGDPMLADLIERYNTPRNKSRYSAGIFDSNAPGEVRSVTPTVKERMASGLQSAMERAGSDRYKARQRAQTIVGGPNSRLPGGFGVADIGAMVNPTVAAAMIPVYAESAMHDLAGVPEEIKRGDYVGAGVDTAFGLADLIPAVGQGKRVAKGVARGIKDAVTSDAGYNLAQNVLKATGTAPAQIMMGENSKTWNHGNAALAKHMELQGADPLDIWQATGTFRGADGKLRQEIPDFAMEYNPKPARKRQTDKYEKSRDRSMAAASTPEEQQNVKDYYNKELQNIIYNIKGKTSEFIDHPELRAAYPELFDRPFKQLDPTNPEYTATQNTSGFFQPTTKTIVVNGDFPEHTKRDTVLHELQHAVQQLEGWQGGSSPALMAMHMADRDALKYAAEKENELLTLLAPKAKIRPLTEQSLKEIESKLEKYKQLEGIDDPFKAYERAAGEEEARAVERRSRLSDEELKEWHPSENYDTPFSEHITDFATGGAVMMAGGKDVTKEAIKQGVKKGIDAVDEFLSSLKPGEKPATAANRVAAGNKAAAMIKKDPPIKASEALGQQMEQGFKKVSTTQSDRTRVGKGNIGGAPFPALSRVDPRYAGKVWGVMDANTAKRLTNLTSPDTLWTTMLGSADQLKTNPVVFDSLESQFRDAMAAGLLKPDLEGKINQNLRLFLGEGADIRDPEIWKALDTFEKRASMADIMMGKGEPPSKGGVPLGGEKSGKGVIFNPSETLIEETELGLLHPEHGGYVPTYALGPRLFTLDGGTTYRPDLHPGFPTLLTGEDRGVNMIPTPTEVFLPDWHQHFKNTVAKQNAEKVLEGKKPRTAPAGYYDLALGLKGEGLPSQDLTDDYIRHLIREGYAEGGEVHMDKGGSVKNAVKDVIEGLRGYVDPIATKISEWNWRPMTDVRQEVPDAEVPEYIQKGYGDFMAEQAKRAAAGDLNARDLIKAYTITRSSVNRGGLPYNTATKTGMQLPRTQGLVRPEGAFAEWLGSPAGQRYLDQAEKGTFTESDLSDMVSRFAPFGMPAVLADDMRYAARNLSPKGATISADVMASPDVYREVSQQLKGIGPAKSGFMASLLGRGDYPTFDARQIRLHTGQGGKDAAKYMTRGKGVGGEEAVARLADRQRAMNMSLDPLLDPFYQHLVHHTVWDRLGNEQTTHSDLVKAMRGYADGGDVSDDTIDEFLSKQGS